MIIYFMITTEDKSRFIDYCLEFYPNNGRDTYIYLIIENQEEEQEHVSTVLPIALEYFLIENPKITLLGEDERWSFFDYLYGNFDFETRDIDDYILIFENEKKK